MAFFGCFVLKLEIIKNKNKKRESVCDRSRADDKAAASHKSGGHVSVEG